MDSLGPALIFAGSYGLLIGAGIMLVHRIRIWLGFEDD